MPGTRPRLTRQLIGELAERIKAGAYEQVAAESLGVPPAVYRGWLARGQTGRARGLCRDLWEAVRQARAHARFMAEMDLRTKAPKVWLLHGPGRETAELPGWTSPARPRPAGDGQGLSALEHPEVLALLDTVRQALVPFPEARVVLLTALGEMAPPGTN
jgi:hypothetical protein